MGEMGHGQRAKGRQKPGTKGGCRVHRGKHPLMEGTKEEDCHVQLGNNPRLEGTEVGMVRVTGWNALGRPKDDGEGQYSTVDADWQGLRWFQWLC